MLWRSSEFSVRQSVKSAMQLATDKKFNSIAFPLIGAGSSGGSLDEIHQFVTDELSAIAFVGDVYIVRYTLNKQTNQKKTKQ